VAAKNLDMTISELIAQLQEILEEEGNLPVYLYDDVYAALPVTGTHCAKYDSDCPDIPKRVMLVS